MEGPGSTFTARMFSFGGGFKGLAPSSSTATAPTTTTLNNFGTSVNGGLAAPTAPNSLNLSLQQPFNANSSASTFNPISNVNSLANNSNGLMTQVSNSAPAASLATYPFQYIQQCFDPNHINYRFRTFFYNVADDLTEAQRIERQTQKPANVSDALWTQVRNDNPDPSRMIPVLANGFGDLHSRARWEDEALVAHSEKLNELNQKMTLLLRNLDVDLTAKLRAAQLRHQTLSLRLIKIMKNFEVLRRSGGKLSAGEMESLQKLKVSLNKLNSGLLESANLRSLAFQVTALVDSGRLDAFRSAKGIKPANSESSEALINILQDQQGTLKTLVDSIQKDSTDLQVIKASYRPL